MSQKASRGWPESALQRPEEHNCLHLDHMILLILTDVREKTYLFGLRPVIPFQTIPGFFFQPRRIKNSNGNKLVIVFSMKRREGCNLPEINGKLVTGKHEPNRRLRS